MDADLVIVDYGWRNFEGLLRCYLVNEIVIFSLIK